MVCPCPADTIDVFLEPGGLYFGDSGTRIRTLLGSCVSLAFWHPFLHCGGMCHYMLPARPDRYIGDLDGRYADEAVAMLFQQMRAAGTHPSEYEVKIFGGANMFPGHMQGDDLIGPRNVDVAYDIVRGHRLNCVAEHTAGAGHRNIVFDVWSGNVWVKHQRAVAPIPPSRCGGDRSAAALMVSQLAEAA